MPELFKTRRQLCDQALSNLGVLATGQTPEQEDIDKIDGHIDPMLATLSAREIIYVAEPEEIDLAVFLPLADCLANAAKSGFGLAGDQKLKDAADEAEKVLEEIGRPAQVRGTLKTESILRSGIRR